MSLIGHGFKCNYCGRETPLVEAKIFGYNLKQILQMERFWVQHNLKPPDAGDTNQPALVFEPPKLSDIKQMLEVWKYDEQPKREAP